MDKKIKMKFRVGLILFVALCCFGLVACSNSTAPKKEGESWTDKVGLPGDMLLVFGKKRAVLGTNDTTAVKREYPEMTVELTYDYFMGKHEVTCSEFYRLMKNVEPESYSCGDEPVTGITYYDAVLYANERSKAEWRDSIYLYTKKILDSKGHCIKLAGLIYRPLAYGYRLPTEAEWLVVASKHWNLKDQWLGSNSGGKKHEVCTSTPDEDGFCDLGGNVMEWTNDWLAFLKDTSYVNFAGAADGGSLDERVIKGGSYLHDSKAVHLYSRGDVYTVSSTTRLDYLGFRLAFGPIPDLYCTGSDGSVNDYTIHSLESIETIEKKTSGFQAKIVFRNDVTGNLIVNDYGNGQYSLREYKDSVEVYHPEISPDGGKVAFCTKPEGVPGKSEIYVRDLIYSGKDLVKLEFENAAIPRWKVRAPGDTVIVFVTDADENTDSTAWKKKETWQVPFSSEEFGEPEKLFDGTFNGGTSLDNSLAVSGARLLRANVNGRDTVWYNGEQACNASLSKDGSNRTVFLDFASATGKSFANRKYGVHQQLLVADSTGSLIHSVPAPKGYAFDHVEWVIGDEYYKGSRKGFVVASMTNANGAHEKISLIDLSDSSVVDLIDGDELWHPCLWIKTLPGSFVDSVKKDLDLDSAARYYVDATSGDLPRKMNDFWAQSDSLEILGLGSSRLIGGFWPKFITAGKSFNLGVAHVDMHSIKYLADNYVFDHCKKLRYLVIAVDVDLWNTPADVQLKQIFTPARAFDYDEHHRYWKESMPTGFIELNRFYVNQIETLKNNRRNKGWSRYEINSWTNGGLNPNALVSDSAWSDYGSVYLTNKNAMKALILSAQEKGVRVVGVVFPQSPYYKTTGSFGRHGMRRSTAISLLEEIKSWEKSYKNFKLMDENKMGDHDYTDKMAYDYDHLSYRGAQELSKRLDSLIRAWDK